MTEDTIYMRRALVLAQKGLGSVSPNPLVGCVIVHQGKIVAEGWHKIYGKAHAEIDALSRLPAHIDIKKCSVFVSLEPCAHQGKTPSCAMKLAQMCPARVIICNRDPFPLVDGKGIEILRKAGIEVVVGVLEAEGRLLNRRFFTLTEKKRPYIILKWAQTSDGFIALPNNTPLQISNALCMQLSHRWRGQEDAILVGANTALADNPRLTCRHWPGPNPLRLVLDPHARLPHDLHLFDADNQATWQFNCMEDKQINQHHRQVLVRPECMLDDMLASLAAGGIGSVIVEGGAFLINSLIKADIWDEVRIFVGPQKINNGINAPKLPISNLNSQNIGNNKFYWQIR